MMRHVVKSCQVSVQGKPPVAADQHRLSTPQSVPQPVPGATLGSVPMPKSDLESSIEAALAEKTQQWKQMADKAGTLDKPYWQLYQEITLLEGQVLTPAGPPLLLVAPSMHSFSPMPSSGHAFRAMPVTYLQQESVNMLCGDGK